MHASRQSSVQADTAAALAHGLQIAPVRFDAVHVDPVVVEVTVPEYFLAGTEHLADAQGLLLLTAVKRSPVEHVVSGHHSNDDAVHGAEDELVPLRVVKLCSERAGVVDHDLQAGDVPQERLINYHGPTSVEARCDVTHLADTAIEGHLLIPAHLVFERLSGSHVHRQRISVADCQGRVAINRDCHPAIVVLVELRGRDDPFLAIGPIQGPALLVTVLDAQAEAAAERQHGHQAQTKDDLTHVSTSQGSGFYLLALE